MKVLFIVSGTSRVAATRYRVYQYLTFFKSQGLQYEIVSIISDFATRLAIRSPEFSGIARTAYYILVFIERFLRFWVVFSIAPNFDLLFLQRATFPFGLGRWLRLRNKRIIFDIDDAIFLSDTPQQNLITRFKAFVKEREVKDILLISNCVIVENDYIKDYVSTYCDKIYKIPGPIDTERYFVKDKIYSGGKNKSEIVIGWIGSPATTQYLHMLDNVLKQIKKIYGFVKFNFIGLGRYDNPDIDYERIEWNYKTEVENLQQFDIGIMSMPDDQWTRGKLGCKMLQYMAIGIPAVVSYTPTNAEIIKDGENGFFARDEKEWIRVLSELIENERLRRAVGLKGRNTVLEKCSLSRNIKILIDIFNSEIMAQDKCAKTDKTKIGARYADCRKCAVGR